MCRDHIKPTNINPNQLTNDVSFLPGEIRDEAHRGYADSRRTVSAMLDTLAQKKTDANCKEVARDGMTCYQCTDAKGFQTEDCAYASNSKDPNNQHVSYSESSSYGDPKQDKHSSTPGDKHKRDGGDTYNFDYEPDFDGIEIDSERDDYHSGSQGGRNSQDPDEHFSGEDDFLTPDEEQDKARYQTPGAFKSGRFRDTYAGRVRSRSKRHAGHYHGPEDNSNTTEHQPVADDSYTGRALARFLSDDEHNHEVGPRTDTQGELQYHEDTPQYRSEEPQYRAGVAQYGEDTPKYLQEVPKYHSTTTTVPQYHSDARPAQRRSGGGYHVRGVVPEYHRKVESSQSSGGGYDRYGTGQRRPAPPPPSQDYTEEHDAGYRDGDHSATIGDLFDYRFGKAPIDDKFVERLQEDRQDDEPAEYEYDDSERPEYEDPNVPDYDYDYQGSGQDYEYVDYPSQRRPSRAPEDTPNRYSDYRDGPPQYYSRNPSGHTYPAVDSYPAQRQQRRGAENSRSTDSQEPEPSQRSYGADGAATYNKDRYQRHQADDRDNSVKERERAQDMAPLNDEPAPYETHTYANPDATRSYEVSAHSRPSLTDDLGMPRGYLHSDTRPTNGRSAPGYGDGSETRYDRPETYASLNRGSAMTRQYQDPGREFFRSHPVGFEHFPNFDYVEKEKKNK
ncbi:uncharacterized protein LOC122367630 [Amphibalanus amphitrite]|uniref:uncharacterized protein LOC122367630 n=1 Tax=Amphibalanus amphitrite TaxID=1232801 RepID=UPI001C90A1D3|nr:uncharacterized protein LOC122367630 [Amphibalanus amphitrite]